MITNTSISCTVRTASIVTLRWVAVGCAHPAADAHPAGLSDRARQDGDSPIIWTNISYTDQVWEVERTGEFRAWYEGRAAGVVRLRPATHGLLLGGDKSPDDATSASSARKESSVALHPQVL